ncbi:neuropeptide Y receptor type 2-like [Stegodyphus dumicola]|uniref:neuropeptide Y receptor type 2-like n=1 Tax=Stegodyphus dumicola TaxID=202533 RepID=UPI0015AC3730|nr:neuropeptide Y receptor type 2-like [Stegodyphus dumicola]
MLITVDPRCNISIEEKSEEYERTINSTFSSEPFVFKTLNTTDYIQVIAIAVIIIGGLLGNISVVLTVVMNRSMRTTINFYVANLAVADAMICIICMIPRLISTMTKEYYALGEFMCKFNPFTQRNVSKFLQVTYSRISYDVLQQTDEAQLQTIIKIAVN